MADDTLINLLAWCKRERERLQMQREMLQSRRFRIFETDESGQKTYPVSTLSRLPPILLNWMGSLLSPSLIRLSRAACRRAAPNPGAHRRRSCRPGAHHPRAQRAHWRLIRQITVNGCTVMTAP